MTKPSADALIQVGLLVALLAFIAGVVLFDR
jgi:hypothetical protein